MSAAEVVTLVIAAYGAGLSTYLGFLALRRDRYRVRMFARMWAGEDRPPELVIFVVNVGFRPITLTEAHFDFERGQGGYLPTLDSELGLPAKLEEGEELELRFPFADIDAATTSFVISDTHRREHCLTFSAHFKDQMRMFRTIHEQGHD